MLSKKTATDTMADLRTTPLVRPPDGSTDWSGPSHIELVASLREEFRLREQKVGSPVCHLSRGGADLVASFTLEAGSVQGVRASLGVAVSTANRRQLRFYVGGWDVLAAAGLVFDSFPASRRFRPGFDLKYEVEAAVDRWHRQTEKLGDRVGRLRRKPLTVATMLTHVNNAVAQGILPQTYALGICSEFPRLEGKTAYQLAVLFGQATARVTPPKQMDNLLAFSRMLGSPSTPEPVLA